jgi:hypothetical protein
MSQLEQPFGLGEPIPRRDVSNVSLSPTTDNKRVTIALKGAGPSLAFQEDLAVGRSFREARFETSVYESVFSNIEVSSGSVQLRTEPLRFDYQRNARSSLERQVLIIDERSPATESFRINPHATFVTLRESAFAVDEDSLRAVAAAEHECEEDFREELRRERSLWKYGRR